MKELKFLLSINLSLILLIGATFPVTALAEEPPVDETGVTALVEEESEGNRAADDLEEPLVPDISETEESNEDAYIMLFEESDTPTVAQTWDVGAADETDATATLYSNGHLVISGEGEIKEASWPTNLISVEVKDGIINIPASAFRYSSVESVLLGESVSEIGANAFYNCSDLRSVSLPGVSEIGYYAFYGCSSLTTIDLPETLKYINRQAFYDSGLTALLIPDSVTEIGHSAFEDCSALTELTIGSGLKYLGYDAFSGCSALTEIIWNAKSCYDCSSSDNIFYAAGRDGEGITYTIGRKVTRIPANLFYTSSNDAGSDVNLIAIENNSTQLETIGDFAFYRCKSLSTVDMGTSLETIGEAAFNSCTALTSIDLPNSLTEIGRKAFFRTGLTSATIPYGVDDIGESAFAECAATPFLFRGYTGSYAEIYAKENQIAFLAYAQSGTAGSLNWTFDTNDGTLSITGNGAIPNYVDNPPWADCSKLIESVSLSDGITAIGNNAFKNCPQLDQITIPATVSKISTTAFTGCEDLEEVYFYGTPPSFVAEDGATVAAPFPEHSSMLVHYPKGIADWESVAWENCTLSWFSNEKVTLTYHFQSTIFVGDIALTRDEEESITYYQGETISLTLISEDALDHYSSSQSKDFIGWNTAEDGFGTHYAPDAEITLETDLELYIQFTYPKITIDGKTYDATKSCSGNGWKYQYRSSAKRLYLTDYHGGDIKFTEYTRIYVSGTNEISGSIQVDGNADLYIYDEATLTINSDSTPAFNGGTYNTVDLNNTGALYVNGGKSAPAISVVQMSIYGSGHMEIHSEATIAMEATKHLNFHTNGFVEITAAQTAISTGSYLHIADTQNIYLSADATESAEKYNGGSYLRLEPPRWDLKLNANGGIWMDQVGVVKTINPYINQTVKLLEYSNKLERSGYLLTGWCDDTDSIEYPVDGQVVSAANLTLFAVWEANSLIVNGSTYNPDKTHSGTGWRYTPASSSAVAKLTLTNYTGSHIYSTSDICITASGNTSISGNVGHPAIRSSGSITLETNGNTVIQGGSGESAILAAENISVTNEGNLTVRGGDGGSAISTPESLEIKNNGSFSAVGGTISYALYAAEQISISGSGKDVFVSGVALRPSVSSGNLILTDDLKFYGGDNANVADRTDPAMFYPYIRIQPKTILVTLNANGGSIGGLALLSSEQAQDESNVVLLEAETPERFGYEFAGWNTRADGSGKGYKSGESYQFDSGTDKLNLYAQWTEKDYDVQIGDQIKVRLREKLPADASAFLVTYDAGGKMLSMESGTISSDGTLRFSKNTLDGADAAKLIFFDNEYRPCHTSYIL